MKAIIVAILLLVPSFVGASNVVENQNDGPYISYKNDKIIVRTIVEKGGKQEAVVREFELAEMQNLPVEVKFSNHPEWNFSVKLQKTIKNEPVSFKQPDKLIAISDIEGEFEALRKLLLANKVIDEQYNWIFGKGHLVICGDLFDRGSQVAETIWLLYKLEQDAKAKGGYLHTILGNHDIMNLSGDLRYLEKKYLENAKLMGIDYMELYSVDTELGRWLRSKNLVEKIGDNLCLHAGVAPEINKLQLSLKQINDGSRPFYDKAKNKSQITDEKIYKLFDGTKSSVFWYRGYFAEPKATEAEVNETLAIYKVKRIIVGHTITATNVGFYYNGKVLGIDVNQHKGKHEGALFESGKWYKIGIDGTKKLL
ncbi:metallophosphoesterase [Pedobacter namyangjuensis]|uniref:metallophosphoesterase n=1 Tax=Pedobacter namyangjuensis TaxID=600626 RepID=UPI000DE307E2|nr:metallophosphoesterase [Pedobacter namyangjuensis]